MSSPEKLKVVPVRLLPSEVEILRMWARMHGRDVSKEVRLAIRLLLLGHMLAHLQTPEGREEAKREGHDPAAEIKFVKKELAKLTREAYTRPAPPPSVLAALPSQSRETRAAQH
jgi:hypothetical protein